MLNQSRIVQYSDARYDTITLVQLGPAGLNPVVLYCRSKSALSAFGMPKCIIRCRLETWMIHTIADVSEVPDSLTRLKSLDCQLGGLAAFDPMSRCSLHR